MRFFRLPLLSALAVALVLTTLAPPATSPVYAQEPGAPQTQRLVEAVEITGNRRLRDEDLLYYIQTRVGEPFNQTTAERDLQALNSLTFFDKTETRVSIEDGARGGINVIFRVQELPIIRDLVFDGLGAITEADVLKAFRENRIGVSKESALDPVKVNNSRRLIRELLAAKGYPNATVEIETDEVSQTSTALTYKVNQGERVRIVEIDFEGNQVFSDGALRSQMKYVKEAGLISRFKGEDVLDRRKLEADLYNVSNFMRSKGYLNARTGEPRVEDVGRRRTGLPVLPLPLLSSTDDAIRITIPITEGKIYRFGDVKIEGNSIFSEQYIRAVLGVQPGEIANGQRLGKALFEDLKRIYGSQGFIQYDYNVNQDFRDNPTNPNEGIADFTISIEEGKQFTLRRLEFQGNTFTRDNVLRRQVLINEGDVYNEFNFENSIVRINQLGYFDPVDKDKDKDIRANEETGEVDLTLRVAERGRQQISFNGGISGIGGSFFGLEYSTNNLLGRGESLSFNFAFGNRQRSLYFTFTEPSIRNREIAAGFTLFTSSSKFLGQGTFLSNNTTAINSAFNNFDFATLDDSNLFTQTSTGGSIFLSAPLSEFRRRTRFNLFSRVGLSYSLSTTSIEDPEVNTQGNASTFIPVIYSQPSIITSRITPTFSYNTSERNGVDAIRGKEVSFSLAFAGLGGDVRTYQPFISYSQFIPVRRKASRNPEVFAFRILAGHVSSFGTTEVVRNSNSLAFVNGVPINERFFLGDEFTIRGYNVRSISPGAVTSTGVTTREGTLSLASNATGTPRTITDASLLAAARDIGLFTGVQGDNPAIVGNSFSYFGGDTQLLGNFEYRVPIVGPLSLAAFADIGSAFNIRKGPDQFINSNFFADDVFLPTLNPNGVIVQRTVVPGAASNVLVPVPFQLGVNLNTLALLTRGDLAISPGSGSLVAYQGRFVTQGALNTATRENPSQRDAITGLPLNYEEIFLRGEAQANTVVRISDPFFGGIGDYRASLGGEVRVQVPVVNVPFRLIFAYNPNAKIEIREKRKAFRFSIGRTF
ncbi:MAG: outer membrane protein assembly factor BamA [Pyrinomonadaceae bacterium MAG19_C2-C3]|nr:outer membrane protein assembly factor BamA [Pyrinomonadaceae bacterium MAG19_C2-C3]